MKKLLLFALGLLLAAASAQADEFFSTFITAAPTASTPYAATDYIPLVRGGATFKIPGTTVLTRPSTTVSGNLASWNATDGSALADSGIPNTSVDFNKLSTHSGNWTIATSDCGATVQMTGAQGTVTLPAVTGFPLTCTVAIKNAHSSRAQILSGFPAGFGAVACGGAGNFCLWPYQAVTVKIVNGAWAVFNRPGKWQVAGPHFYVGPSGSCSDNNDGLAATSAAQLCTVTKAKQLLYGAVDALGTTSAISMAAGNYTEAADFTGGISGTGGHQISLSGPGGGTVVWTAPAGQTAISAEDHQILTVSGIRIDCSAGNGLSSRQYSILDVADGMDFTFCDGHTAFSAVENGRISVTATAMTFAGNAAVYFGATGPGSYITIGVATYTISNNITITGAFANAGDGGQINVAGATFSLGANTVTGQRYVVGTQSRINTAGAGTTFFPGTVAGSVSTSYGVYE